MVSIFLVELLHYSPACESGFESAEIGIIHYLVVNYDFELSRRKRLLLILISHRGQRLTLITILQQIPKELSYLLREVALGIAYF